MKLWFKDSLEIEKSQLDSDGVKKEIKSKSREWDSNLMDELSVTNYKIRWVAIDSEFSTDGFEFTLVFCIFLNTEDVYEKVVEVLPENVQEIYDEPDSFDIVIEEPIE